MLGQAKVDAATWCPTDRHWSGQSLAAPLPDCSRAAGWKVVASLAAVLRQANNLGVAGQLISAKALDDPVLEAVVHVATAAQFDASDRATALSMLGIAGTVHAVCVCIH